MAESLSGRWELYPLGDDSTVPVGVDAELYCERFLANTQRLFASEAEKLDVIRVLSRSGEVESYHVDSAHSLHGHIKINKGDSTQDAFYLIPQQTSWGRFSVSLNAFKLLLASHRVFVPFLDFVQAYGSKTHEDHHNWKGYRWKFSRGTADMRDIEAYEFCYNLQYVDLNGRDRGDPWSLRQCGVYQQICLKTRRSTWILLQVSKRMRVKLDQALRSRAYKNDKLGIDPVVPHIIFISAMAANWQDYLEYLHSQLAILDEKACFSRVDYNFSHDFSVNFQDNQNLQLLRQKLLRTSTVLDSCLQVVKGCEIYCRKLTSLKMTVVGQQSLEEIRIYIKQMQGHRLELHRILQHSLGTSKLLFTILDFRNSKTLQETNQAIRRNLDILQRMTSHIRKDNITLAELARQGRKDSRTLKILSVVATIYLPASLIATIFSSSLVQSLPNDASDITKGSHLAISPQLWIFVVTSFCLTVVTIAYPLLQEARQSCARL